MNQRTVLLALFALALIFFSGCLQDPTVQVQVFVRDEQGNPVPDAYVYAYSNYSLGSGAGLKRIDLNGTLDASALTDAQGRATLNILPGNYAFQATTQEGLTGTAEKLVVSNREYVEITVSGQQIPVCGNGFCEENEDSYSCPEDCGIAGGELLANDLTVMEIGVGATTGVSYVVVAFGEDVDNPAAWENY